MEFNENLTESKSSTSFVFFRADKKNNMAALASDLAGTYFDFSSETAERNSAKLDRKQDLNVLHQVCVFRVEKWMKNVTLANTSKKVAHCTQVHVMGPLGLLFMNLFRWSLGGCTNSCISMGTHSQPLIIRTPWWMFIKLGKDEVLMAPYMH